MQHAGKGRQANNEKKNPAPFVRKEAGHACHKQAPMPPVHDRTLVEERVALARLHALTDTGRTLAVPISDDADRIHRIQICGPYRNRDHSFLVHGTDNHVHRTGVQVWKGNP